MVRRDETIYILARLLLLISSSREPHSICRTQSLDQVLPRIDSRILWRLALRHSIGYRSDGLLEIWIAEVSD